MPPSKIVCRIAVASDGHYGQENTAFDFMHTQMINWLNEEKASRGINFSVINGDIVHDDASLLPRVKARLG